MSLIRFLKPKALGFTLRQGRHALLDKLAGAPPRTTRAAEFVKANATAGDPADALRALDEFSTHQRWLMSVGPMKGPLIEELAQRLPAEARILELGAYCGYSAILIASALGPQCRLTSIEISADAVASARSNVAHAGLAGQVEFIHGPSHDMIAGLEGHFDLVFLDHWKDLYLADLRLIEQRGLLREGSIVVADNVGEMFGADAYLDYVRNCGHYRCENREATIEYTSLPDAVEISTFHPSS